MFYARSAGRRPVARWRVISHLGCGAITDKYKLHIALYWCGEQGFPSAQPYLSHTPENPLAALLFSPLRPSPPKP
ncbi:hypothetical protein N7507_007615 [Penicillium longicatenatum]|nr:hypothetical protein N7507_007615 [Penicillium longicatenatum]